MRINVIEPERLPISVLRKKWAVEVLTTLEDRTVRFGALRDELAGITAKSLGDVLRQMQEAKLVTRTPYPSIPPRVEYSLTPLGLQLLHALQPLQTFAARSAV